MNTTPGFWGLFRYALAVGFFTGLVSGTGFGLFLGLLFSSGGLLFFAGVVAIASLSGMLIGTVLGAVNGFIIASLTHRLFSLPVETRKYHRTMGWACTLGSLLLGVGTVAIVHGLAGFGVIAIPIVVVAGWWASQKVCDWYMDEANTPIAN